MPCRPTSPGSSPAAPIGASVLQLLADKGALDRGTVKVRAMVLPDTFLDHDKPERMYATAGLDAAGIIAKVFEALGREGRLHKRLKA
nr:hypothetical protein [Microvirga alba]